MVLLLPLHYNCSFQFMALTLHNAVMFPMFLIWWRIIKSIVCYVHCYKHLLADECKQHAKLTQENQIRCQADAGKDLHPLVFRSLLDLQAAVLRLNKVRSAHWLSGASLDLVWGGPGCVREHWEHWDQLRRVKTTRERLGTSGQSAQPSYVIHYLY